MKTLLIGIGAAGNKAVMTAINMGVVEVEDTIIINSTTKDFPKDYKGKTIVLSGTDTGCGKERSVSKEYTRKAISDGKFNFDNIGDYISVIIATSVEGGTGSGSAPIIAKLFNQVYLRNTHIIAFTGFEDDVRGLSNTVEFFKEIDSNTMVQTISNKTFLAKAGNNKLKAEELANREMAERISVLTGKDFIEGSQNIDDTDILKLSNTHGYMTVEKKNFTKSLETREDFEKVIKNMINVLLNIRVCHLHNLVPFKTRTHSQLLKHSCSPHTEFTSFKATTCKQGFIDTDFVDGEHLLRANNIFRGHFK